MRAQAVSLLQHLLLLPTHEPRLCAFTCVQFAAANKTPAGAAPVGPSNGTKQKAVINPREQQQQKQQKQQPGGRGSGSSDAGPPSKKSKPPTNFFHELLPGGALGRSVEGTSTAAAYMADLIQARTAEKRLGIKKVGGVMGGACVQGYVVPRELRRAALGPLRQGAFPPRTPPLMRIRHCAGRRLLLLSSLSSKPIMHARTPARTHRLPAQGGELKGPSDGLSHFLKGLSSASNDPAALPSYISPSNPIVQRILPGQSQAAAPGSVRTASPDCKLQTSSCAGRSEGRQARVALQKATCHVDLSGARNASSHLQ